MNKTKFALIGCGEVAKKHVQAIQNILPDAEMVGCCDVVIERAEKFTSQFHVSSFSSAKQMMEKIGNKINSRLKNPLPYALRMPMTALGPAISTR
jgi:hypothetical protein